MKRGAPLKRRAKPKKTELELLLMRIFLGDVRRKRCAVCGEGAPAAKVSAHHVLRRQVIERILGNRGLSAWEIFAAAWDPRWRMPICPTCHGDHHSGMRRISLSLVRRAAPDALEVAGVHDLTDYLESEHTEE